MGLPPPAFGGYDPYQFGYIVEYEQPQVYYRPGIRLLIRCFAGKPDKPFTYDAAALEQSLKQRYRIQLELGSTPPQLPAEIRLWPCRPDVGF